MADPFTIRIYVPEGDSEGVRIIDRLSSNGKFFAFPRVKWDSVKSESELDHSGIYILSGYEENADDDKLPTIYIGQADSVRTRIGQHLKSKDFWDKAVVFVSVKMNSTQAKWLEYALVKRAAEARRAVLENGNSPQEPNISDSEKADMNMFLREIYQTLPLVGTHAFEIPKAVAQPGEKNLKNEKDTIVVPAKKDGFERVFLGEDAWYAIRISGGMLEKIKYIAAYQAAPISAITHVARVVRIEPYGEEGKYKLLFSGKAEPLDQQVPFGDAQPGSMQGPRYTNFERLKKAKKVTEIF